MGVHTKLRHVAHYTPSAAALRSNLEHHHQTECDSAGLRLLGSLARLTVVLLHCLRAQHGVDLKVGRDRCVSERAKALKHSVAARTLPVIGSVPSSRRKSRMWGSGLRALGRETRDE